MDINEEAVKHVYDLARDVYNGKLTKAQAVETSVENGFMSKGSAQDYIQNFRYIMDGVVYKRTMNLAGTRCYLENIYQDYGIQKLSQALEVVAAHVQYYNSLGYGKQVQTRALVDEFLTKYGIDFHKQYGDLGTGYIHVHHELELSEIGEDYVVDPIKDLKPVCPNCHAMLHKTKPAMAIEKLKELLTTKVCT